MSTCSTPLRPSDEATGSHATTSRSLGEQAAGEDEGRRLARVVGAGLNASPSRAIRRSAERAEELRELADHAPLLELVHLDHGVQDLEVVARVGRELLQREGVLREARAAEADPGRRKLLPIRRSWPMPSATLTTSAPVASQTFAISLMNEIRVIRAAFAASLIISAEATSLRTIGASMPSWSAGDSVAVRLVERADHDPVGLHEVLHGRALGRELRVRGVADVGEPARVEPVAHLLAGADRDRALHRDDDVPLDVGQLVDHRPDGGEIGVARVGRRRPDRDVDEVRALDRLAHVVREREPLGVPLEQVVETGLVDRHLAAAERLDAVREDVAHDDVVAELGKAGARDEADVARAEDRDALALSLIEAAR